MAKINLLTMHYDDNNGAFLQTYATSKVLQQLGHKVTIINLVKKDWYVGRFKQSYTYKLVLRYLKFRRCRYLYYPSMTQVMFKPNIRKIPKADYTIVGSDQVWNPMVTSFCYSAYFLTFLQKNQPRLSLSSSFGKKQWEGNDAETTMVRNALKQFKAVSVREKSSVDICKQFFDIEAVHLSDPTLVLDNYAEFDRPYSGASYIGLFTFKPKGYSLEVSKIIGQKLGLPVKWVNAPVPFEDQEWIQGCKFWKQSPIDWYNYIRHSSFFISDSFHGVVFCLILHRPFFALVANEKKLERIVSLLETFGLQERLVYSLEDLNQKIYIITKPIDWTKIDQIRKQEREKYVNYVKANIE